MTHISPFKRLWSLVQEKRSDITAIYFYAILSGLIQLSLPVGIQAIIGFVLGGTLVASLVVLIVILVVAVLLVGIMQINQMKIIERIQQRIFVKYAFAVAERLPQFDLKKIDSFHLPELVNRFFDTNILQKSISKLLLDLPTAFIQIFFGLLLLTFYHPLFILFGILLILLLWGMLYITGNKGLETSLEKSTYKYRVAGWFEEMARLFKTFKFSSSSGLHVQKADQKTVDYLKARTTHFKVLVFQYKTLVFFKVTITAAMLTVGVMLLINQQINIGQFVATEIIILSVIAAVEKIIVNLDSVYDVLTAVEKLSHLTEKPIESRGKYELDDSAGISVEARNLDFSYDTGEYVLSNLSFSVMPGDKACVTGPDGTGKTTLLKLLLGVYNDFSGRLLINNIPIGNYDLDSLRKKTGILFPQENIFDGTLWENIAMGHSGIDKNYVAEITRAIGLQSFVSSLPYGYDTPLDPTGRKLPRNVINKILLVRALSQKPRLLVLEEPWQNIEERYRKSIQELLLQLSETTVVVVTNDPAFALKCNHVIELKEKEVAV